MKGEKESERERERGRLKERGREWKREDRGRKGVIPEIIKQDNDAKEGHEIIT